MKLLFLTIQYFCYSHLFSLWKRYTARPRRWMRATQSKKIPCGCSIALSCLTLCDPMDCSMPGFPALHYLSEFAETHVHWVKWCHPTISFSVVPFSLCLLSFPASGAFPMSQLFSSGGQSIGASASASALPLNIQSWFPLGLTGLISLQSKELLRVSSSTTIQKHQFFSAQTSLWSNSHITFHYWKNHSFD